MLIGDAFKATRLKQALDKKRRAIMRSIRFIPMVFLVACFPTLVLGTNPSAEGTFSKEIPGSDRRVPTASAVFEDTVFFEIDIEADDGEHSLEVNIYDGNGKEVLYAERAVRVKANRAIVAISYGFDTRHDAPGTWWYTAALDKEILVSRPLRVTK